MTAINTAVARVEAPPVSVAETAITVLNPLVRKNRKVSLDLQASVDEIKEGQKYLEDEEERRKIENVCEKVSLQRQEVDSYSLMKRWYRRREIHRVLDESHEALAKVGQELVTRLRVAHRELTTTSEQMYDQDNTKCHEQAISIYEVILRIQDQCVKPEAMIVKPSNITQRSPSIGPGLPPRGQRWDGAVSLVSSTWIGSSPNFEIYEATTKDAGGRVMKVAVKRQKFDTNEARRDTTRLLRQIGVWSDLKHPRIIEFYGWQCFDGDKIQIVMPYLKNRDVAKYLTLNVEGIIPRFPLIYDFAEAINFLHSRKPKPIVHCTLWPGAVLITDEGRAMLADFSTAKYFSPVWSPVMKTAEGTRPEIMRYASPEASSEGPDGREGCMTPMSDVWSWAMVSLEIMTSKRPFELVDLGSNVPDKVKKGELPNLGNYRSTPAGIRMQAEYPRLEDLFNKCWELESEKRPTIAKVLKRLKELDKSRTNPRARGRSYR